MNASLAIAALVAATLALPAAAADTGPILKGKEITESALIDALKPGEAPAPRTRSIGSAAQVVPAPKKPASASLLITFETNSADLTKDAKASLDKVGKALQSDKLAEFKFDIEGHADPRGGSDLNQQLSLSRAEAVRQYLVHNHGVNAERLKAIGKGDSEPLNTQNPIAAENRRVTIKTIVE